MRAFGLLLLLIACDGGSPLVVVHDPDAGPIVEEKIDLSAPDDPCGPKDPNSGLYGCAFLVGGCPKVGLSCYCWENGTMVCQADQKWELIGDSGCPFNAQAENQSYQGLGCLGGHQQCGGCFCDSQTKVYQCSDGGA
jgi:hypothetical protein